MDDMPQWIFALSIVLASRDVFAVVAFALPIYGFLWGWW